LIQRIAILAPFSTTVLKEAIPNFPVASYNFPKGMGGSCIGNLVRERISHALLTDIITLDPTANEPIMRWVGEKVRIWIIQRRSHGALRDGFRRETYLIQQALRESNPDICHANWTYEYGLAAISQDKYPVILTVHDHAWNCLRWIGLNYLPLYLITQYVLRKAAYITTVSPYLSEYLKKKLGRNVPVIPNLLPELAWKLGKEKTVFSDSKSGTGQPQPVNIISAINWSRLKNTKRALRAFQIARKYCMEKGKILQYTLVGPGLGHNGPAEKWAQQHHCVQGVVFHGNVPYVEALQMIASANILMHPSHEEAMPGPISEAMLMKTPVAAAREAGGSRWLLDDGHSGLLFSGISIEDMALVLISMILQPQSERIAQANERIVQISDAEKVLQDYETVYEEAINGHSKKSMSRRLHNLRS